MENPGMHSYIIKQIAEDFAVREISSIVPQNTGRYTYFLLTKKNYTTEAAVQRIAKQLRMPRRFFGFAGNKDRKAITEQMCSVLGNIRSFQRREISVSVLGRGDEPVSLGDLHGNRFEIVIRGIGSLPKKVNRIVNYFDSQRFGMDGNNQLVGKLMLKRDFKAAAEIIMGSNELLMAHLKQSPNDYVGAIRLLPKKVFKLYLNAYQSYLWNLGVKEYLEAGKPGPESGFPIIGFGTEIKEPVVKGIVERLLKADGLTQRDFVIREIPELTSEGSSRRIFADVTDLSIGRLEDDELNPGKKKVLVKFTLGKGSYATMVIKEMFS